MNKWFAASLGVVLGISHMGLVGLLVTRQKDELPTINIPTTDYSTYQAEVTKDGYKIAYRANDPKTMYITKDIKEKAGFLGLANNTTKVVEEYVMDGKTNQGGAVSNKRSWIDNPPGLTQDQAAEISAQRIACIKAVGSGEGTGRVVGTSIGAAAAPTLSSIPFVGWVAAGWVAMFGGNQGAEIGGNMAEDMSKDC
jgi:hypothetical protein